MFVASEATLFNKGICPERALYIKLGRTADAASPYQKQNLPKIKP